MKNKLIFLVVAIILISGGVLLLKGDKKTETAANNGTKSNTSQNSPSPTPTGANCDLTQQTDFRSLDKLSLATDETNLDYWTIRFDEDVVVWKYAGITKTGTYFCRQNQIDANFDGEVRMGLYNPIAKNLVFDGHNYKVPEN